MKINPFKPFGPVNPGAFVGRLEELRRLKSALIQTTAGSPVNFMITGERGIGKTSLMLYLKYAAEGMIPIEDKKLHFVVVDTDIDQNTTQLGMIAKIELGLEKALSRQEAFRDFVKKAWGFVQRVEGGGFKLNETRKVSDELLLEEFAYSLAETANRVCSESDPTGQGGKNDGILILIDEADKGSKGLHLGSFFKLLSERLQRRSCNRVMFGLAGLPELRKVMHESHPSSLRIFDELALDRLSVQEVNRVIDLCLKASVGPAGSATTSVSDDARDLLVAYSEGYPHFIQQFGFSAFAHDTDNVIDQEDVLQGAHGPGGAFEQIGDRYYRDDFYKKIHRESYRKVLRIMAENLDGWVTKQEIRAKFKGANSVLNNALKALLDRKIIRPKEGDRGVYRLQHKAFAAWIRFYTADPDVAERLVASAVPPPDGEA